VLAKKSKLNVFIKKRSLKKSNIVLKVNNHRTMNKIQLPDKSRFIAQKKLKKRKLKTQTKKEQRIRKEKSRFKKNSKKV